MWLWAAPNKEERTFSYTPILPFGWHIPPKGQSICLVLEERSYKKQFLFFVQNAGQMAVNNNKKSPFEIRKTSQYLSLGNGKKELQSYFFTFLANETEVKESLCRFSFSFKA